MAKKSPPSSVPALPALTLVGDDRHYAMLVDSVIDYAIFTLDPNGRVATWNRGAERLKGYSASEIIGKHFSQFYPDEDIATGKPPRELAVASSVGRYEEEGWRIRKDGTRFWANVVITAMRGEDGRLVGFAKVTRDVTERRAAQELLRQSEERFRLIVESVRDYAVFMLDPDGYVLSWNLGAQRTKGYAAREIVGEHFSRFYTPEDLADDKPGRELRIAREEGRYEEEGWRVRKDGTRFWASVVLTRILDGTGRLVGFAKVTRDVTERMLAQEELASAKAELEETNQELQAFSYSVAHDLRAPLRAIRTYGEALRQRLPAGGGSEQEGLLLDRITTATRRMGDLTDSLLLLARVTSGDIAVEEVDLVPLARDVVEDLRGAEPGRDVEFVAPDQLLVRGDKKLLGVVMDNLLRNAWKFTRPVPSPRVEMGAGVHEGRQACYVRDNGVGFDMAHVDKVFQPFQRLHPPEQFEGSGIGLATVCRAVRRQGGNAWAESSEEGGATFWFTVDAEAAVRKAPRRAG